MKEKKLMPSDQLYNSANNMNDLSGVPRVANAPLKAIHRDLRKKGKRGENMPNVFPVPCLRPVAWILHSWFPNETHIGWILLLKHILGIERDPLV
jgi:hypothetical protein